MTPLTLACVRARRLLALGRDGPLDPADEAALSEHLEGCAGCRGAQAELERAFAALDALSPEDVAALAQAPALDPRRLGAAALLVLAAAIAGVAWGVTRAPAAAPAQAAAAVDPDSAPRPPAARLHVVLPSAAQAPPAPGASAARAPSAPAEPARAPGSLPPEAPAQAEPGRATPPAPPPLPAPPEEARASPARAASPEPPPAAPPRPAARPIPASPALPAGVADLLARLETSEGLRYRDVTFFWVRDPGGRDRISSAAGAAAPPRAREERPHEPDGCTVAPDAGGASSLLLGELLDTGRALRVVQATLALRPGSQPAGAVALGPPPAPRQGAFLRAALVLPSGLRRRLVAGERRAPRLLEALGGEAGLARVLAAAGQVEAEARELERRLRARLRPTRGLRGVGVSIRAAARSLDLFASARDLSDALPRLIRAALVEAALEGEALPGEAAAATPQGSLAIHGGVTASRAEHRALLALAAHVRATEESAPAGPGSAVGRVFRQQDERGEGWLALDAGRLRHAVLVARR